MRDLNLFIRILTVGTLAVSSLLVAQEQQAVPERGVRLVLLTDPQGIDFKPYLQQIASVSKSHWRVNLAEHGGPVVVQASIEHSGTVSKIVFVSRSGSDALDRAAVQTLASSNPFPPAPTEFKGERILLQFTFAQ
ncbi:exported hypothetical protein [Candidatus Sulfopaludibacter sp. SbA3]|nr:exported hypothetical protein [Candidatus Sulfopaludibacter sp. SbA3]